MEEGGWGIVDPFSFKITLTIKNMRRAATGTGICSIVIKDNYMYGKYFTACVS